MIVYCLFTLIILLLEHDYERKFLKMKILFTNTRNK